MLQKKAVFSGFSVNDLEKAKTFYTEVLGLKIADEKMGLQLELPHGGKLFIYPKENHEPATFTVLNFVVDNIDEAVDELTKQGVGLLVGIVAIVGVGEMCRTCVGVGTFATIEGSILFFKITPAQIPIINKIMIKREVLFIDKILERSYISIPIK